MKVTRILAIGMFAALFFAGFFMAYAAAEGTSFEDAKVISEGTYTGTIIKDYYYQVNVPAHKAILVTLTAGDNSDVSLTLYNAEKQESGVLGTASASNGENDKAFYDAKSNTTYTVYIKLENMNLFTPSNYTITVKFVPSDMMSAAMEISNGQKVSGTIEYNTEAIWYKINVPKGEILNVSFSSSGGEIMVDLYDSQGNIIDSSSGTTGYVNTKLLGNSGTIYIRVSSAEIGNNGNIQFTITPTMKKGSSTAEEVGTAIGMTCIIGIVIGILVIVLIIVLIIKLVRRKK